MLSVTGGAEFERASFSRIPPTFVDPRLDWGFKRLLQDPEILIDFLNTFLPANRQVSSVTLQDKERVGESPDDRTIIFDVRAIGADQSEYIIEVQRRIQEFFTGRSQYYIARELNEQGLKGGWPYQMTPVNLVAVLDYQPKAAWLEQGRYHYQFELLETSNHRELDNIWSISYVVLPHFKLACGAKLSRVDLWCFLLKNLGRLNEAEVQVFCSDKIFSKIIQRMRFAALTAEERDMATLAQMREWDKFAVLDCARKEGRQEGREEGLEEGKQAGTALGKLEERIATYRQLKEKSFSDQQICDLLGWQPEEFQAIQRAYQLSLKGDSSK